MRSKKVLAFICKICPFCILSRQFPDSKYAKFMEKAEKNCSCCKAYNELNKK